MPFDSATPFNILAQHLIEARQAVEQGWCQAQMRIRDSSADRYCVVGAMYMVASNRHRYPGESEEEIVARWTGALRNLLESFAVALAGNSVRPDFREQIIAADSASLQAYIIRYNDHATTSKADVLRIFDKAIAQCGS